MESGCPNSSSLVPKTERKVVEKNRRNHMKILYSKLSSLLPDPSSKEELPLPDQIDEAVKYIEILQLKLAKSKEKKEKLLSRKRSRTCTTTSQSTTCSKPHEIDIQQMGPDLCAVLINGPENQFIFNQIIRMFHEEGGEVVHASFSPFGNSIFHVSHGKIGESMFTKGSAAISKRLKELISGTSSCTEVDPQLGLWDFDIQPDLWEFGIAAEWES